MTRESMRAPSTDPTRATFRRILPILALLAPLVISGLAVGMLWGVSAPVPVPAPHVATVEAATAGPTVAAKSAPPTAGGLPDYFPPRIVAGGGLVGNCSAPGAGPVIPGCGYYKEAAPMGIADYGVSGYGNPTPYAYSTVEFVGRTSWSEAYLYNSSLGGSESDEFTVQLNVELNYFSGAGSGQNYTYWIQDVAVPSDGTKNTFDMSYEDNIWNMSTTIGSGGYVPESGFSGNGSIQGGEYYYDTATGTGSGDSLTSSWFELIVLSTVIGNHPVVRFCYLDSKMSAVVCYDSVTWTGGGKVDVDHNFLVDGYTMNPMGLFDDAELTIGGPGGGTYTKDTGPTDLQTELYWYNGHNLQPTPSAFNMGDNTAESVTADQAIASQDGSGTPLTTHLNGTARDDKLNLDYSEPMVGTLAAWDAGTSGTVTVGKTSWDYAYGWASVNLEPGTYGVYINATGGTNNNMGSCTITANTVLNITAGTPCGSTGGGSPTVGPVTGTPGSVDVGQPVTFSATVSGGTPPYAYTWSTTPASGLGCGALTGTSLTCTPTNSNIYSVTLSIIDSAGKTGSGTLSSFTVYPDPTVSVPVASPGTVQVGQTVVFSSTAGLAGSGSDSYAWTASGAGLGCTASTTLSYSCTPTAAGTYTVTVTVTDSNLGTGSNTSASFTVTPVHPTVSVPVASPHSSTDVGLWVNFTSTLTNPGAGGTITYAWTETPGGLGCTASTSLTLTCVPTATGSYTIVVTATDGSGNKGSATLTPFVVYADPALSGVAGSPSEEDVTQGVTFTATVANPGSGGDTFTWSTPAGLGCAGGAASTDVCNTKSAGTYTVSATVTDSDGGHASTSITYTVAPDPAVTDPIPNPAAVTVGEAFTWTTTESGGFLPYTYTWSVSPASGLGCASSSTTSLDCTPTAAGTYTVTVTVKDGSGLTASASSAAVTVTNPVPLSVTGASNVTSGYAALAVGFSATASGGVPTYTYTWRFGDGGTTTGSTADHVFAATGTYVVWLWVNDSAGHSASWQTTITVNPLPAQTSPSNQGSGSSSGLGSYWWLLLLIAAVAVAAIVGAAYVRHKHNKEDELAASQYDGLAPAPMGAGAVVGGAAFYGGGAAPPPSAAYSESVAPAPSTYLEPPAPAPTPSAPVMAPAPTAPPPVAQPLPDSDKSADETAPDPNHWVARPAKRPPPVPGPSQPKN